jgi:hypothetical protein
MISSPIVAEKQVAKGTENAGSTLGEERIELRRVACHLTESLFKRVLRRVFPDQRRTDRHVQPPLVGYLGVARATKPYRVGDISLSGFCILTEESWMPGTEMPVTLERTSLPEENNPENFTVQATVVRCGKGEVGFSIVLSEDDSKAAYGNPLRIRWVSKLEMESFLQNLKEQPETDDAQIAGPTRNTGAHVAGGQMKPVFEGGR